MWWLIVTCGGSFCEMWRLIGSSPDFQTGGLGFESGISHNDPEELQDHCAIL